MSFGAKVKITVDKTGAANFRKEIQQLADTQTSSNPIKVKIALDTSNTKSLITNLQSQINNAKGLTVSINNVDASGAIEKLRSDITTMLKGVKIDGVSAFLGDTGMKELAKDADSATNGIRKTAESIKILNSYNTNTNGLMKKVIGQVSDVDKLENFLGKINILTAEISKAFSMNDADRNSAIPSIAKQYADARAEIEATIEAQKRFKSESTKSNTTVNNLTNKAFSEYSKSGSLTNEQHIASVNAKYKELTNSLNNLAHADSVTRKGMIESVKRQIVEMQQLISSYKELEHGSATSADVQLNNLKKSEALLGRIDRYVKKNPRVMNMMGASDRIAGWRQTLTSTDISDEDINKVNKGLTEMQLRARAAGLEGKTLGGIISDAYKRFGGWMLVTRSLMEFYRLLRSMVTTVTELDSAMGELKKVTDLSTASYDKFFDNAISRAKELGTSVRDTIKATADFARLGYGIKDAEKLADAAIVYKNVGDGIEDINAASESIISTMKAFNDENLEAMSIVDKFNKVGNEFAISSKGIGDALQRSSAALAAAGNTLDESIGMAVGMNTVLQNPEKVGTTLQTASMYLRAAKAEAEDAGEATDGMANSVSELREKILTLTGSKVDIMIDDSTFKSTVQIYRELAKIWGDLEDIDAAAILELIGGKRNATANAAILTNFEEVEKAISASANSEGSALKENEKVLNTVQGKLNQLKATFEELSSAAVNSEFLKGTVEAITKLVELITKLVDLMPAGGIGTLLGLTSFGLGVGGVKSLLSMVTLNSTSIDAWKNYGAATKGNKWNSFKEAMGRTFYNPMAGFYSKDINAIKAFNSELANGKTLAEATETSLSGASAGAVRLAQSYNGAQVPVKGLTTALIGQTAATVALSVAQAALSMAITVGITAAITGLITLVDNVVHESEKFIETAKEAKEEIDGIKSKFDNLSSKTEETKERFAELSQEVENFGKANQSRGTLSTEEYEEFLDLSNQLAELFPQLTATYDDNGNAILNLSGDVDTVVESLESLVDVQRRLANEEILEKMPDVWKGFMMEAYGEGGRFTNPESNGYDFDISKNEKLKQGAIKALKLLKNDSQFEYLSSENYITSALSESLKKMNLDFASYFGNGGNSDGKGNRIIFWEDLLSENQIEDLEIHLGALVQSYQDEVDIAKHKMETANTEMSSYINTWLSTDAQWYQAQLSPELQNLVKDVLLNTDWINSLPIKNTSDWEDVSKWLKNNFLLAIKNIENDDLKTELTKVINGNFSSETLTTLIEQLKAEEGFDVNNPLIIYLQAKLSEEHEAESDRKIMRNKALGMLKGNWNEAKEYVNSLSDEDLSYVDKLDFSNNTASIEEFREALYNLRKESENSEVTLSELADTSGKIGALASAYKELSDDGYITTKTLSEIQTATGLSGDEWEKYKTILLNAKIGSAEFNNAMSEMTFKILDTTFKTEGLVNVTEDEIAAVLRENGVTNASTVAHYAKQVALQKEKIATAEVNGATEEEIKKISEECEKLGLEAGYFYAALEEKIKYNAAHIENSDDITSLLNECKAVGALTGYYQNLGLAKSFSTSYQKNVSNGKYGGRILPDGSVVTHYEATKYVEKHGGSVKDLPYFDPTILSNIDLGGIDVPFIDYSGNSSGSGGQDSKDLKDLTDAKINRINLLSKEIEKEQEYRDSLISIAKTEEDLAGQFSLTSEKLDVEIKKRNALIAANSELHNWADEYRKSIPQDWDVENWFNSLGEETEAYIEFWNKHKDDEKTLKIIETTFSTLSKIKKAYLDNDKKIQDTNKSIPEIEQSTWDIKRSIFDKRQKQSQDYIEDQMEDGWLNGDNVVDAYKRYLEWVEEDFYKGLIESEEEYATIVKEIRNQMKKDIQDVVDDSIADLDRYISKLSDTRDKYNEILDEKITKENALLDTDRKLFDIRNALSDTQWEIDTAISDSRVSTQYLNEEERKRIFNDSDYAKISKEIKDIDKLAAEATSNYQRKINNAWRNGEIYLAESLVSEHEQLMEFYERRLEISKAEVDLAKKKNELENTLANRNIRQLVERNGKLEWEWVADNDKVRAATENLMNAQHSLETLQNKNAHEFQLDSREKRINGYQTEQEKNNAIVEENSKRLDLLKTAIEDITTPLDTIANLLNTIGVLVPEANSYTQGLSPLSKNLKVDADGGYWSKEKSQSSNSIRLSDMPTVEVFRLSDMPIIDETTQNIPSTYIPNISTSNTSSVTSYNIQGDIVVLDVPDVNGFVEQLTSTIENYT